MTPAARSLLLVGIGSLIPPLAAAITQIILGRSPFND